MLSRVFVAVVALLALTGFADPGKKFTIDFPAGWSEPVADKDGNVQSNAPDAKSGVYCRANSVSLASLKDVSQAAINTEYAKPLDAPTWAGVLSVDAAKMKTSNATAKLVDGHVVQFVTIAFDASVVGFEARGRFASHILTGHMVNVGCFAPSGAFDGAKAAFEKIVVSLKAL